MLAARHAAERLQNCWHGGARSTTQLREAMSAALAEYVTSGDSAEAARCLAELDVPHFHHELVKCVPRLLRGSSSSLTLPSCLHADAA